MLENSHLYKEINQQPQVLQAMMDKELPAIKQIAATVKAKSADYVMIAARGTSDNAARYGQYLFGAVNRLPVALASPSLYSIYKTPPDLKNGMVIGISQSGKSPDIVSVLREAGRQGAITVAITNFPDSDLAKAAEHTIELHAGLEQSVAATKTYTTQVMAIALLSAALAENNEMLDVLTKVPAQMEQTLKLSDSIATAAERYRYMKACVVIGRGYNYSTAFELSLKIKELNYVMADPYSSADFMHGPVALIEQAFPAIIVAPSGVMLPEIIEFVKEVKSRGAEIVAISDDEEMLGLGRTAFRMEVTVPEWASPLLNILPGQLLAMHLAHVRDYDVDKPRGLLKVTETM